jgi:hypothetical protein
MFPYSPWSLAARAFHAGLERRARGGSAPITNGAGPFITPRSSLVFLPMRYLLLDFHRECLGLFQIHLDPEAGAVRW